MEVFTIILAVLMMVFAILQIILFFKVWRMTCDVRSLRQNLTNDFDELKILRAIAKKDENLDKILFDAMFDELYVKIKADKPFHSTTISKYKKIYQKAGIEFPPEFSKIDKQLFHL